MIKNKPAMLCVATGDDTADCHILTNSDAIAYLKLLCQGDETMKKKEIKKTKKRAKKTLKMMCSEYDLWVRIIFDGKAFLFSGRRKKDFSDDEWKKIKLTEITDSVYDRWMRDNYCDHVWHATGKHPLHADWGPPAAKIRR